MDENGLAVVVTEAGVDHRTGQVGDQAVRLLAHDLVSRVSLIRVPLAEGERTQPVDLGSSLNLKPGAQLYPSQEGDVSPSRIVSRESEYNGTALPFELFRVHHHPDEVLFPGHPLFDSAGRLVAINYRKADEFGNGSFAFPVEVVERMEKATVNNGEVQRSWFGVELLSSDPLAVVQGVRQASPAAKAGIVKGDILIQIGPRRIEGYADAINAFFYLCEGEEVAVKFLRGTEELQAQVMPQLVPSASSPPPAPAASETSKEEEGPEE